MINFFKDTLGLSNSSMVEVMNKDGQFALKCYLPDVCGAVQGPAKNPSKIISVFHEYPQVFRGGVKDQFLLYRSQYSSEKWQKVALSSCLEYMIFVSYVSCTCILPL